MFRRVMAACILAVLSEGQGRALELPGAYFRLMEVGIKQVQERLSKGEVEDLRALESREPRHRHFPHLILVAAVLYTKRDPNNHLYQNSQMLSLAVKIGDLLAAENDKGHYAERLNSHRDTYMWLEAYRVLEKYLQTDRRTRWRGALEQNLGTLATECSETANFPGFQSPFIGTSPNHLSLWASTLYLGGRVFHNGEWEKLGARIMHRFAVEEQSSDGYWGEHEKSLPTPGYDYTTYSGMALYWELSQDATALAALRRGLDFHKFFTYPDGTPVEVIDDRNRFTRVAGWGPSASHDSDDTWPSGANDESASKGHFGFSNFPDGRRYAAFLTSFFHQGLLTYEDLGRIAQNALYYHAGPEAPIPQDLASYERQLSVPASIRKSNSWVVCLSGLISTQAVTNQFYHDRQGHLSIFHEKTGLIVTGANSKRQPELATFSERQLGQVFHLPLSSRLRMGDKQDRLSLAYNSFFAELTVPRPSKRKLAFRFTITGKEEAPSAAQLTLQLCLKPGELLETGAGRRIILRGERVELEPDSIAGWIRNHGWTLKTDARARLVWPVFPHNPYTNSPENNPINAVGALSVPLDLRDQPERYIRPGEQEIKFALLVD